MCILFQRGWGNKVTEYSDVDWQNIELLHDAYWPWNKALNDVPWSQRGANIPEALTEAIVCMCIGGKLIKTGMGDVLVPGPKIGEVKATSKSEGDLTSFSPSEIFDCLYFVIANPTKNHIYSVYDLKMNRKDVEKIQVSNSETFRDQAEQGRRPRFSIIEKIIRAQRLTPTWLVDVKSHTVSKQ
jgi:hypothetical protein